MPPKSLTLPTPAPVFSGSTNADLDAYIDDWRDALQNCNADKVSIEKSVMPLTTK